MNNNFHKFIVKIIAHNLVNDYYDPYRSPYDTKSIGSGCFINNNGLILTCAHVVDTATKLEITIPSSGKNKYIARILSISPSYDLAVIKIDYQNEFYLELGDSDKVQPGENVSAYGYPLGQDRLKVTKGIISGYQGHLFQTDTPINPGNSGGPLINENNEVIGINSQKISAGKADNIGYSVPINYFKILKLKMINDNDVVQIIYKPELLCKFTKSEEKINSYLNKTQVEIDGYLIKKIHEKSCLYEKGVRQYDILLTFDNFKIDKYGETAVNWSEEKFNIRDIIYRYSNGQKIDISYFNSTTGINNITVILNRPIFKLLKLYPNITNIPIDYEIIFGIVITNFHINHVDNEQLENANMSSKNKNKLILHTEFGKRFKNNILVTNVLTGYIKSNLSIKCGSFITHFNDIQIINLNHLRYLFLEDIKLGKINYKLTFDDNNIVIFDIKDLLNEFQKLQKKYNYRKNTKFYNMVNAIINSKYNITYE